APLPGRLKDFFVAPLSKESPMPWLLSDYVKPSFEEGRKADYLMGIAFIRMPVIALPPWLPAKIKPKKPKVSRGKAVGAIELVGKTTSEKGVATVAPMSTTATRYVLSAALSGPEHESFTGATTRQISKRKAAAADSFAPIRIKHAFVFEELISSHPRSSPYITASLVTSEPFSTCVWGKLGAQCPDDESSNAGDSFKTNLLSATPESRLASGKGEVDVSKTLPPRSLTPPLVASQPRPSTSRNVTASSWSKVKTALQKNLKPNSEGGNAPEMSKPSGSEVTAATSSLIDTRKPSTVPKVSQQSITSREKGKVHVSKTLPHRSLPPPLLFCQPRTVLFRPVLFAGPISSRPISTGPISPSINSSTQWHCKVDSSFEKRLYHKKTSGQNHQFDYLYGFFCVCVTVTVRGITTAPAPNVLLSSAPINSLASVKDSLTLVGIRDHNAVKLLEADWALMDFQAYVNETVAGNSPNCGGLAMVSTREGYAGLTKFDDFSTVAVTPLRQPYRWCHESVLSAMGTAKEVGRVRVFDNDGCLEMLKTSSMTSLQERERSRVLEVVLHETGESSVRKVVDWQCETANVSYADSDAETVLATDCREELEPATSAVAQTRTNGAEWHRWAENVPHVDSEAETVPDTG
ncbi:hypothetical protein DAPPUDRAFT_121745, partial [Daphnia pulex]